MFRAVPFCEFVKLTQSSSAGAESVGALADVTGGANADAGIIVEDYSADIRIIGKSTIILVRRP